MLSSPLRRCLLTNKVLPTDLLVKFALVRPPPIPFSSPSNRMHLVPSGLLHPRFDPHHRTRGKGGWVTCWKDAVEALAHKGSYKRLDSSAFLDPSTAVARVHSQLARRAVQEVDMFAERAKSWPISGEGGLAECPVRRMTREEWEAELKELAKQSGGTGSRRRQPVAVLNLSPLDESSGSPLTTLLTTSDKRSVPSYRLANFFADVFLPPSTLPSSTPSDSPPSSASETLLSDIRTRLDFIVSLWRRRAERSNPPSSTPASPPSSSPSSSPSPLPSSTKPAADIYLLTTPHPVLTSTAPGEPEAPEEALRRRQAEDAVPLLVALRRCSLWTGEGWEASNADTRREKERDS
ncbi:hypothetical protein JCM6882_006466 [Rhodosporidiobolus microsporus]